MNRAYSVFDIKSFDEAARTFEGVATTPTPDRMDDIVDPMGAEFKLPMPMMWQHGKGEIKDPVGWITHAAPNQDGIPVRGQMAIPKDDYPQSLKDELNGAWVKVRDKLVRGLSIGFRSLEAKPIKSTFGTHIKRWEWLELSPVAIPAHQEATILTVKQFDARTRAALGHSTREGVRLLTTSPGASGTIAAHPGAVMLTRRS